MKFKGLTKLSNAVQQASAFAEEIKQRVSKDLETLESLDSTIAEVKGVITQLETKVNDANQTLSKLKDLLG